MIVSNPEVTLDIEAHGIPDDARDAPFLDWLCSAVVHGDDGRTYWFGTSPLILGLENRDMWNIEVGWESGQVVPLPGTIFKLADFPPVGLSTQHVLPGGTLKVERSETEVRVTLGEHYQVICKDDHTWHYTIEDKARGIKAEFVHIGKGCPLWYGREKPSYLTPHSIAYGYNWSGRIEGKLTLQGREIAIKGKGIRERYIAVDSSAAEIGGWEDWMWFHFDEVFGSMYEMKLGQKDMVLNLAEEAQFFPAGEFTIEHLEWAWLRALGAFIPTRYRIRMEVEAGVLMFTANVVGATVWGVTATGPSTPVATLNWDALEGTFTYRDGRTKTLSNGLGSVSIRQWKPYPDVFGAALANVEGLHETGRMTTL
ncbi:hypothetical protein LDO26_13175 [Luteimonas sp. BDR2-5]|uniref:hypothetical protein n=1 Tax=Proluteimonas luteida TaxID=2878685 RepID=UPI001E5235C7|nr:hypothetical protein [Luteimonas sp. BDR2-5]MCD9029151.1 hypothetical protein [Luteimonas sp. BDR2-5]